jgi:flavodoxin
MKTVILYESFFGNTKTIAKEMGKAFPAGEKIQVLNITKAEWQTIYDADYLIVGSATRRFRPCEKTKIFLKNIPPKGLAGIKVAAFDTRIALSGIESKSLRFIVKTGGYAAKHIASSLKKKGGELITQPEGFLVTGEEGPLLKGEKERASEWAKNIISKNTKLQKS